MCVSFLTNVMMTVPIPITMKKWFIFYESPNNEIVHYNSVELKGHSLLCFTGDECNSKLRILRAASTHYAVLRSFLHAVLHSFLHAVYDAIRNHKRVAHLDAALHSGDFTYLMRACEIDSYESLLSNVVQSTHQVSVYELDSPLRKPNLEYELRQLMPESWHSMTRLSMTITSILAIDIACSLRVSVVKFEDSL